MRYFTLENSDGETLDVTTKQILFHDISGLGFGEETDFRRVGDVWHLNSVVKEQTPVSGKMLFSELGGTSPYEKYLKFKSFIAKAPLIITYYPLGIERSNVVYHKRVRVSKLEKSELTQYGILDCPIDFTPYTPWYQIFSDENQIGDDADEEIVGWIWGDEEGTVPPLVFEPDVGQNATVAQFGAEPRLYTEIKADSNGANPVKITIFGPARNPVWTHFLNGEAIAFGSFAETFELAEYEALEIDNTEGDYTMNVRNIRTNAVRNVYALRNFDTECFFKLGEGTNRVIVSSENSPKVKTKIEGHIYYATV